MELAMNASQNLIDLMPVESERLSAREFLNLVHTNPGIIKQSKAVPAALGSPGLGAFEVTYTRPVYKPAFPKRAK